MRNSLVARIAAGIALVIAASAAGVTAGAVVRHPHVIVSPSSNLRNGEVVKVRGAGFVPKDSVFIVECLATAKGQAQCDTASVKSVTINAQGQLPVTKFKVRVGKIGSGTCGTNVKNLRSCAVSVGNISGKDSASARITFVKPR